MHNAVYKSIGKKNNTNLTMKLLKVREQCQPITSIVICVYQPLNKVGSISGLISYNDF